MKMETVIRQVRLGVCAALVLVGAGASYAQAQDHDHGQPAQAKEQTPEQKSRANQLVKDIRDLTAGFQTPDTLPEGYNLLFGCVSGGEFGAMGLHYVNLTLVADGKIDKNSPEAILYEPLPNGKQRITGVDYIVDAAAWDAANPGNPPQIDGQLFHFFDKPNRFGLDPFYTLHVWAWKENPNGTFTNWNPNVSCDAFNPQQ